MVKPSKVWGKGVTENACPGAVNQAGGKRRKKWQSLTQTHDRHFGAAQARAVPQSDAPAAAEHPVPTATTAASAPTDREQLQSLRSRCLALGVQYSISDSVDELKQKVAEGERLAEAQPPPQAPRVPAAAAAAAPEPAQHEPPPAPAAGPEPAPTQIFTTRPETRCCDCCGQLTVPYVVTLNSCWLCRGSVCGSCMPPTKYHAFDVRRSSGSRTVQACRSCAVRGGPPAGHPKVPTGIVRRDDAFMFAPDWFARCSYLYSAILCGYPWPPQIAARVSSNSSLDRACLLTLACLNEECDKELSPVEVNRIFLSCVRRCVEETEQPIHIGRKIRAGIRNSYTRSDRNRWSRHKRR